MLRFDSCFHGVTELQFRGIEMQNESLTTSDLNFPLDVTQLMELLPNSLLQVFRVIAFVYLILNQFIGNWIDLTGLVDGRDLVVIAANLQKILDGLPITTSVTFGLVRIVLPLSLISSRHLFILCTEFRMRWKRGTGWQNASWIRSAFHRWMN